MKRIALVLLAACSSNPSSSPDGGGTDASIDVVGPDVIESTDAIGSQPTLAQKYKGDVGMQNDPSVVWMENFEEGSSNAVTSRYDSHANTPGLTLETDVPAKSSGKASGRMTSNGDTANATDLYKSFSTGYDEWYVRWYAKYEPGTIQWHHTGNWFGGYSPATPYPNPQAGLKPNGDDRFSISIEPVFDVGTGAARFDTYDYWMQMHSWMDIPQGNTAYYGNAVVHQNAFKVDEGNWVCLEVHVKMNTDLASGTGAMLEIWKDDALVQSFWTPDRRATGSKTSSARKATMGRSARIIRRRSTRCSTCNGAAPRRFSSTTSGRRITSRKPARRPGWSTTTW